MKSKCIMLDGKVINIGNWDYLPDGKGIPKNPLPPGAYEEIREINETEYGLFDSSDYKECRKRHYPPIGDQLDALYHAGLLPKEISDRILSIKLKFPKPNEN